MIIPLLLSLVGPAAPAGPALQADDPPPPIRVDLNHEQFSRGDRARVYVETAQDGHLVVLHADPDGRVRVLFPLDPSDDDFVRSGKRREIRGRSDRDAFFVDAGRGDGAGTVLAVLSPDPLSYDGFVRNDHWDYRALAGGGGATALRDDPLAGLLDIARRMAGETRFEYDAATYIVGGRIAARYGYGSGYGYGHPYRFRLGLAFGYPYGYGYDPFCYDPWWGWSAACSPFGFGYSGFYYSRPYFYGRYPGRYAGGGAWPRGFVGGSRFVIPRDRVRVTGIEPRRRVGSANSAATTESPQGSRKSFRAPRGSREPSVTSRGAQPRGRGPSMSPRGGSSRGPSVSRPSGGSRGRAGQASGGARGTRGGGGGGRRH